VVPEERLQLQSLVVRAPPEGDWEVSRAFDAGKRVFLLAEWNAMRQLAVLELDRSSAPEEEPDRIAMDEAKEGARSWLSDPDASIAEIPYSPDPRLGGTARARVLRAEEHRTEAETPKRTVHVATLVLASSEAPARTAIVAYQERGPAGGVSDAGFLERWKALLDRIEPRPATPEHVAAAARADDFPKFFQPGLARRSLTLPRAGFQWGLERWRWVGPGGFSGGLGFALGVTDHVQLAAPGFVSLSFGEVEALTRPECAVGGGLTRVEHDAARGTTWSGGIAFACRRRIGADVALRGRALGEVAHESRTDLDHLGGSVVAGVAWDAHPYVTLGLESGYRYRPWERSEDRLAWVGGLSTPVVTLHVPFLDLGLRGGVGWDRGRPGLLAGFSILLTL
jgi:hypothetical protein